MAIDACKLPSFADTIKYLILGLEEATETKKWHLQGFIYFSNKKSFQQCKQVLEQIGLPSSTHIEQAKGSLKQNFDYCRKDGDFMDYGKRPFTPKEKAEKTNEIISSKYEETWQFVKAGQFQKLDPAKLRNYEYARMRALKPPSDRPKLWNFWIHGPSGTGKSSTIRRLFLPEEIYYKPVNKWWDHYQMEPICLIEDLEPSHHTFLSYYLKLWADHYVFTAEQKGSVFKVRPGIVIITSQYSIEQCFALADQATRDAMHRRFEPYQPGPLLEDKLMETKQELLELGRWKPSFFDEDQVPTEKQETFKNSSESPQPAISTKLDSHPLQLPLFYGLVTGEDSQIDQEL
jgi:hypothetical protein